MKFYGQVKNEELNEEPRIPPSLKSPGVKGRHIRTCGVSRQFVNCWFSLTDNS